jgi:hypothetical protein
MTLLVLVAVAVPLVGCTEKQRKAISETAVRNAVAVGAAKEFNDRGYPIKGDLTCTAKATNSAGTRVSVTCKGVTTNGHTVEVQGTTEDKSANDGNFVGAVDGRELFRKSCLGCKV